MTKHRLADEKISWGQSIPYILFHLTPLLIFFTGVTWFSVLLCGILYFTRMFFVTAGFHRYFAHRGYSLNRFWQFVMAFGGTLAVQKGPLWWAGHHRNHHQYSDTDMDVHSPIKGFIWSHVGWILCKKTKRIPIEKIQDFAKFPELRWLDKYYYIPPTLLAISLLLVWGPAALMMGFFVSTIILWHVTYSVNSMAHKIGSRRYVTNDTSRNFLPLALLTGGEGWHNNHHYFPGSAKQGFFWWEIDTSYYVLKIMSWFGIVKRALKPPKEILQKNRIRDGVLDIGMFEEHWRKAEKVLGEKRLAMTEAMHATKQQASDIVRTSKIAPRVNK